MHRRNLLRLGLGINFAACIPLLVEAEADAATRRGADESVGLTVMYGGLLVACVLPISRGNSYAIRRGWYLPPDPNIDYSTRIGADGVPFHPAAILMLTPAGRAHGTKMVHQWQTDTAHPFHEYAINPQSRHGLLN